MGQAVEKIPEQAVSGRRDTWIVIPAFNEEAVIRSVVTPLIENGYSVVVVDDGSSDQTSRQLKSSGAVVCVHPLNLGQGAALQTGISYALSQNARFIITFDADGQHSSEDIPALLWPLEQGEADVVLGSRFLTSQDAAAVPLRKRLFLKAALLFTKITTGLKITDTHNGIRAFTAASLARVQIHHNGMTHASEILHQIANQKMRFTEVPVHVRYTSYSISKGQKMSNSINIVLDLLLSFFRVR